MKKQSYQIVTVLVLIVAAIFFLSQKKQPHEPPGCFSDGKIESVRFKAMCHGKNADGTFKIDKSYIAKCNIDMPDIGNPLTEPGAFFNIPMHQLEIEPLQQNDVVNIEMHDGDNQYQENYCDGRERGALIDAYLQDKNLSAKISTRQDESTEVLGVDHRLTKLIFFDRNKIKTLKSDNKALKGDEQFDIFFKKSKNDVVEYVIFCRPWTKECNGTAALLQQKYEFRFKFPFSYEQQSSQIAEGLVDYLQKSYH